MTEDQIKFYDNLMREARRAMRMLPEGDDAACYQLLEMIAVNIIEGRSGSHHMALAFRTATEWIETVWNPQLSAALNRAHSSEARRGVLASHLGVVPYRPAG
jgi:hypothetical protein